MPPLLLRVSCKWGAAVTSLGWNSRAALRIRVALFVLKTESYLPQCKKVLCCSCISSLYWSLARKRESKGRFPGRNGGSKGGILAGNAKGGRFQFHLLELVQMPWAGDKDTATAALAGSNHPEVDSGQVSPATWISEFGPTATTDILLAN